MKHIILISVFLMVSVWVNFSFASCDPCICGFGGDASESQQDWLENNCKGEDGILPIKSNSTFSCTASGEYRSPQSFEIYSFVNPVLLDLTLGDDPVPFGPTGNNGGALLKINISEQGDGFNLGLHDGSNIFTANTVSDEVALTVVINSTNFRVSCLLD